MWAPPGSSPHQASPAHPCLLGPRAALESHFFTEKHLGSAISSETVPPLITQMHLR